MIRDRQSFLCVGLDTDLQRIPKFMLAYKDPLFEFNKLIIEATSDLCVAYKPNLAFYEMYGVKGLQSLERTMALIKKDRHFTIADAKRGDIGNTSSYYARAFFESFGFDAVTVAPYMGRDSVEPFLQYEGKWVILLALTSNPGSADFQQSRLDSGELLHEKVIRESQHWGHPGNLMYVVGATHGADIQRVRKLAPEHFFLVPGIGAQGGDLDVVSEAGINAHTGLLVNASRSILYASNGEDFAEKARAAALELQQGMQRWVS